MTLDQLAFNIIHLTNQPEFSRFVRNIIDRITGPII